jgi:hypothetical protein
VDDGVVHVSLLPWSDGKIRNEASR